MWPPFIRHALWSAPIVLAINETMLSLQLVRGHSMTPTLQDGDVVLVNKFVALCLRPALCSTTPPRLERGKVVTMWSPYDPWQMVTKRIIALQGDWLHVRQQSDFVRLRKGQVWVEGDAQGPAVTSEDCTTWGPIPMALIQGTVEAIVWPPSRAGWVETLPPPTRVVKMNDAQLLGDA